MLTTGLDERGGLLDPVLATILIAAIVATGSVGGPLLLSALNNREATAKEKRDYARQDSVAERLVAQQNKVAAAAATASAQTVASLGLLAVGQKQIHELVNSNLTASMQDSHDATVLLLAALEENVADKIEQGKEPSPATSLAIATARVKVAELEAQLRDRAQVQAGLNAPEPVS